MCGECGVMWSVRSVLHVLEVSTEGCVYWYVYTEVCLL